MTRASVRLFRAAAATLAVSAAAVALPAASSASASCKPPAYPGSGYFTSLTVSGTSCSSGSSLVKGYYKCRLKHGRSGRCTSKVNGYSCKETRNTIATEFDARVTCKKGGATVTHTYQQNL